MSASQSIEPTKPDGRALRSERNRAAILDAFYCLLEEGALSPSARMVAERTGIAERTVYRHFSEIDSLFDETTARLHREIRELVVTGVPSGTLEQRAHALVVANCELYERIAPFVRARDYHVHRYEWLAKERDRSNQELLDRARRWLPELRTAPTALRGAIEAVLSFEFWNQLRTRPDAGPVHTAAAVEIAAMCLVDQLAR